MCRQIALTSRSMCAAAELVRAIGAGDGAFAGDLPSALDVSNVRDVFMAAVAIWLMDAGGSAIAYGEVLEARPVNLRRK
jgi:hypothetical protein